MAAARWCECGSATGGLPYAPRCAVGMVHEHGRPFLVCERKAAKLAGRVAVYPWSERRGGQPIRGCEGCKPARGQTPQAPARRADGHLGLFMGIIRLSRCRSKGLDLLAAVNHLHPYDPNASQYINPQLSESKNTASDHDSIP